MVLHGCTVENGALIGMGSTILNGAKIGEGALVAAGALVPEGKIIEPGVLVAGVPAKVVRTLTPEHIEHLKAGAFQYVRNGANYMEENIVEKENILK